MSFSCQFYALLYGRVIVGHFCYFCQATSRFIFLAAARRRPRGVFRYRRSAARRRTPAVFIYARAAITYAAASVISCCFYARRLLLRVAARGPPPATRAWQLYGLRCFRWLRHYICCVAGHFRQQRASCQLYARLEPLAATATYVMLELKFSVFLRYDKSYIRIYFTMYQFGDKRF